MNLAIETQGLGKRYGDVRAVEDLSLRIAEGEIYAFLGLNGAGKNNHHSYAAGYDQTHHRLRQGASNPGEPGQCGTLGSVGYLVEIPHSYPELTVRENLEVARRLHPGTPREAVSQVIERMGLAHDADRRSGNLSQGNAQRLGLAKALLHHPKLLFLDEPANGLDPAGIVEVRELLLELTREQGVTVFMSSHILAEVARLARRIGIIHQGRLLQELNIDELERNRSRRLLLHVRDVESAQRALTAARQRPRSCLTGALSLRTHLLSNTPMTSTACWSRPASRPLN